MEPGTGDRMSAFGDAFVYLNDPLNWTGSGGILDLLGQHLYISGMAVLLGLLVGLPVAIFMGHTGRGGGFTVAVSNVSRAVPTLALLTIFAVVPGLAFTDWATILALGIFAIPPILTNTYVGIRGVDRDIREAAAAMGMSGREVIFKAEIPLAMPLIMTGVRTAGVQVVATTTLAALVGGGGLGDIINLGFGQQNVGVLLAGALLVAVLSLLTEFVLVFLGWLVTPGQKRLPWRSRSIRPVDDPATSEPPGAAIDAGSEGEGRDRELAGTRG